MARHGVIVAVALVLVAGGALASLILPGAGPNEGLSFFGDSASPTPGFEDQGDYSIQFTPVDPNENEISVELGEHVGFVFTCGFPEQAEWTGVDVKIQGPRGEDASESSDASTYVSPDGDNSTVSTTFDDVGAHYLTVTCTSEAEQSAPFTWKVNVEAGAA